MAKVIGLVNLHSDIEFTGLTERRPVASVSFLGRYGIIDFVLSNMSNSKIDAVGVMIQQKPRSLFKHLKNGISWNFNQKAGGVSLLYNEKYANDPKYNHDINNLVENIHFLETSNSDYVVIAPAHVVTTMDYTDVIDAHEKSGATITMVYTKAKDADVSWVGCDILDIENGLLTGTSVNKGTRKKQNISLETYVINTKELISIINKAHKISAFYDLKDILGYLCDEKQIHTYEYKGYARYLDSTAAYFKYSLEMLDIDISSRVFKSNWPIYTNTNDTPPTKYLDNAEVKKSFVANGTVIDGTIENSIIGREVVIGKGAVIKNCVIFSGSKIAPGAVLENVIIDKRASVEKKLELKGTEDNPLYIKEGDRV